MESTMFTALRKFAASTGMKVPGRISKDMLTTEERDAAIKQGMDYFRKHKTNFYVDARALRSAVRGLLKIAAMKESPLPECFTANIAPWVEMQIQASDASTYANLFHQGQTNKYWKADKQLAAKEACAFFNI